MGIAWSFLAVAFSVEHDFLVRGYAIGGTRGRQLAHERSLVKLNQEQAARIFLDAWETILAHDDSINGFAKYSMAEGALPWHQGRTQFRYDSGETS